MHKFIKYLAVILLSVLPSLVLAQTQRINQEKLEALKVGFLTQKLGLSADEAKIFWPIYNDFTKEQNALRKARIQNMISYRKVKDIDELADSEIQTLIMNDFDFKQKDLNVEKKYYNKLKTSGLSMKIVGKFYRAQEAFKKELLNRFRNGQQN